MVLRTAGAMTRCPIMRLLLGGTTGSLITSAEGGNVFTFVGLFVLFVCLSVNTITQKVVGESWDFGSGSLWTNSNRSHSRTDLGSWIIFFKFWHFSVNLHPVGETFYRRLDHRVRGGENPGSSGHFQFQVTMSQLNQRLRASSETKATLDELNNKFIKTRPANAETENGTKYDYP